MDHKKYLSLLLHEASTIFGVICFLLAIVIFPMLGVDSKYISTITYIGALGSLYWSSYKICKSYYFKFKDSESRGVLVKQIDGSIKFQSGNGKTFKEANLWVNIGINNQLPCGVSITEIGIIGDSGSKKVSFDNKIKVYDSNNERNPVNHFNLSSGESKIIKIHRVIKSSLTESVETANYFSANKSLKLEMSYKLMSDIDVQEKTLRLDIPMTDLIERFQDEWQRTRQKEALAIIT